MCSSSPGLLGSHCSPGCLPGPCVCCVLSWLDFAVLPGWLLGGPQRGAVLSFSPPRISWLDSFRQSRSRGWGGQDVFRRLSPLNCLWEPGGGQCLPVCTGRVPQPPAAQGLLWELKLGWSGFWLRWVLGLGTCLSLLGLGGAEVGRWWAGRLQLICCPLPFGVWHLLVQEGCLWGELVPI